jgi:hypothetical protein
MAIRRILADSAFDQGAIDLMVEAYEAICKELQLAESRYAPANEAVAQAVVRLVREGQRDAAEIVRRVVQTVQPPR